MTNMLGVWNGKIKHFYGDGTFRPAETEKSECDILDQITFENYGYYLGFDNL